MSQPPIKLERRMIVHADIFDAAQDDASRTVCESLGVAYDDDAKSFWKTSEGTELRASLQRFGAHVLIRNADAKMKKVAA